MIKILNDISMFYDMTGIKELLIMFYQKHIRILIFEEKILVQQ